jgi:plasmid stability protein
MPVNLSIKGVPDPIAAGLRARAARNHRSLQRELMAIIEVAVATPEASRRRTYPSAHGAAAARAADDPAEPLRPIEEVLDELWRLFPRTNNRGPSGTEIIREMRDGRYAEVSARSRQRHRSG